MNTHTPYRPCPACAATDRKRLDGYSQDPWVVGECKACGFVYLTNPPAYEALEEDFAWEVSHAERQVTRGGSTPASKPIRKLRNAVGLTGRYRKNSHYLKWFGPGRVLDIGCGGGHRLAPPITPYGIELSKALHAQSDALMRNRGGYCVHGAGAEALSEFDDGFFDGVLMFSYLEHEVQLEKTLKGVHRVLKPGGKSFIRVPNFGSLNRRVMGARWCGFRWPDHVNYFTLKSLKRVTGQVGFSLTLVNTATLPVDDNIQVLITKADRA